MEEWCKPYLCLPWRDTSSSRPWISCQVCGARLYPVGQGSPGAASSLNKWNISKKWVEPKDPMMWPSALYYGGGPFLSMFTLQIPIWPFRGIGSHLIWNGGLTTFYVYNNLPLQSLTNIWSSLCWQLLN